MIFSDIELDVFYSVDGSTDCYEEACCHDSTPARGDSDKAPEYGTKKCNMPLAGFKKMIDTINALNRT